MDKEGMREWISSLEEVVDNKLCKWHKHSKIENGEAVHLRWQFEQTHIQLDIFWENHKETVSLKCMSPRSSHDYFWHGLNNITFNKVIDRVGNLAQVIMHPPLEFTD